jgi:hypothetical protein
MRLAHGRRVLLDRASNLEHVLEAIFAPSQEELFGQVRIACAQQGHSVPQIAAQLADAQTPLYA